MASHTGAEHGRHFPWHRDPALTLQSVLLQGLNSKGVLSRAEALEVVDKSLDAVMGTPDDEEAEGVAKVAHTYLEQVREGLEADLVALP